MRTSGGESVDLAQLLVANPSNRLFCSGKKHCTGGGWSSGVLGPWMESRWFAVATSFCIYSHPRGRWDAFRGLYLELLGRHSQRAGMREHFFRNVRAIERAMNVFLDERVIRHGAYQVSANEHGSNYQALSQRTCVIEIVMNRIDVKVHNCISPAVRKWNKVI